MFRNYKKSMADKQNRAGVFVLLVFAFFILSSQSAMAANENGGANTTTSNPNVFAPKPGTPPGTPPGMPPTVPPGTPPTFPIPPQQPPIPLVAPAASSQPLPSAPGVLVPIPTVGATTNVARIANVSSTSKLARCIESSGSTLTSRRVRNSVTLDLDTKEKCCYPPKANGEKTCIKCIYPGGDASQAICTKNTFKSVIDTPKVGSQDLPTTNAPPKPLTRTEELERGKLNPGSAPGGVVTPTAPIEESPQGGYTPIGSPKESYRME